MLLLFKESSVRKLSHLVMNTLLRLIATPCEVPRAVEDDHRRAYTHLLPVSNTEVLIYQTLACIIGLGPTNRISSRVRSCVRLSESEGWLVAQFRSLGCTTHFTQLL